METKSLNLNIEFAKNRPFIRIYSVKGINPRTLEKTLLGIYTNEDTAIEKAKFWKETMEYNETWYELDLAWL